MFVGNYFVFVAACSLQLTSEVVSKNSDDTRITFPGPIQDVETRYGSGNNTDPCEGLSFCTVKPDDYPQELFNNLLKGKFKEPVFRPTPTLLDDRQGDSDDLEDCESSVLYEPLYKVRSASKEGRWLTVVQAAEENFIQMVRLEVCKNAGSKCFTQFKGPDGLVPFCKQTYNEWELLVHDEEHGTKKENVILPICCSCHYKPKK